MEDAKAVNTEEIKETGEADLYEPVRKNEKTRRRRRDVAFWIVGVVLLFSAAMIFSFWWNMSYWKRFAKLSSSLSEATAYAYKHGSAVVNDGAGGTYALSADNAYEVYQCVCVYGPGRERFSVPEGEGVTITYGNGSALRLMELGEGDGARLYFCFFSKSEKAHVFSTNEIDLAYLVTRYLAPEKQN